MAPNYTKQHWKNFKKKRENLSIVVEEFNMPVSKSDISSK